MAERSEAKNAKRSFASKLKILHIRFALLASLRSAILAKFASLRIKTQNFTHFVAKLRFALLASLRSAIFSEILFFCKFVIF